MENTLENKSKFFAIYWGQEVAIQNDGGGTGFVYDINEYTITDIRYDFLELKSLSQISDEDAIEVARILYGESDNFAIEFNAAGITSVSPYGLPCYGNTIDINWSGEVSYEAASSMSILKAYDYLRSKGYALPWMGLSVEQLVEYGWVKLNKG